MPRSDEWTTPKKLFDYLNEIFRFTVDAAATDENHLVPKYYTKETNALQENFEGERVFCNPPYSLDKEFAEKIAREADFFALLLPVRSDRQWFQKMLHGGRVHACWITGRLHFGGSEKGAFMYSLLFYKLGNWGKILPDYLDASVFNDNGKGGAKK